MSDQPTHIYISGPMRNFEGFNFPAFFAAEALLRQMYPEADICNPAREDCVRFNLHSMLAEDPTGLRCGLYLQNSPEGFTNEDLRQAMGNDLHYIVAYGDLVVLLPGWQDSKGATAEAAAALSVGCPAVEYATLIPSLSEALPVEVRTDWCEFTGQHKPDCWAHNARKFEDDGSPGADEELDRRFREEVRVTSATGGQKGTKLAAFDQVSPEVEMLVAEHFGKGARKYDAHNFRRGYPWSLSYSALRRHLAAFWAGEEYDNHKDTCPSDCVEHTGSLHIVAVIWHAMVLTEFFLHRKEYDDRYVYDQSA